MNSTPQGWRAANYWRARLNAQFFDLTDEAELHTRMSEWVALNVSRLTTGNGEHYDRASAMQGDAENCRQPWDWLWFYLRHAVFYPGASTREPTTGRDRWRVFYQRARRAVNDEDRPSKDMLVQLLYLTARRQAATQDACRIQVTRYQNNFVLYGRPPRLLGLNTHSTIRLP